MRGATGLAKLGIESVKAVRKFGEIEQSLRKLDNYITNIPMNLYSSSFLVLPKMKNTMIHTDVSQHFMTWVETADA